MRSLLLAVLACSPQLHAQSVLLVDAAGGGDYTSLQAAVDGASEGDLIQVREGLYAGFSASGKSLHIAAQAGELIELTGQITLSDLDPGQTIIVRDFLAPALQVVDSFGSVRITHCQLGGAAQAAVWLQAAFDVALTDCSIEGAFQEAGMCLEEGSRAALFDSECRGGWGYPGGTGIHLMGSGTHSPEVYLSGSYVRGGSGGDVACSGHTGNGGDGLWNEGGAAWVRDCQIEGGSSPYCNVGDFCNCSEGWPGQDILGDATLLSGLSPNLRASASWVPESQNLELIVEGPPGQSVILLADSLGGYELSPRFSGAFLLGQPLLDFIADTATGEVRLPGVPLELSSHSQGIIPSSGTLSLSLAVTQLPVNSLVSTIQLQAWLHGGSQSAPTPPVAVSLIEECTVLGEDCNQNGTADACDIAQGTSEDCNQNGLPDECEWDCNQNGVPDDCDIASGTSSDINGDGVPDECEGALRLHVDAQATPGGVGFSWADALDDLQEALGLQRLYPTQISEIWVASGTYRPHSGGLRTESFHPGPGARVFGGFAGWEVSLDQRDLSLAPSILSGDLLGDDTPDAGRDDNSHHVVLLADSDGALIDGFEIRGGEAIGLDGIFATGAGIWVQGAQDVLVSRCFLHDNRAHRGAGLGTAPGWSLGPSTGRVLNSRIAFNQALIGGGSPYAAGVGAGAYLWTESNFLFVNCELVGNDSIRDGSALSASYHDQVQLLACTVADNVSYQGRGAIHSVGSFSGSETIVQGSIVWNTAPGQQLLTGDASSFLVTRSCIQGGYPGFGNTAASPRFTDPSAGDYTLLPGSPCIDASRNGLLPFDDPSDLDQDGILLEELPLDLAGFPRRVDDPLTTDTGSGPAPILDMGAHEYQPR